MEIDKSPLHELTPIEVRVLACLMEKELTTPDQYPLTENAIKLACNQKTNRVPVMHLESGEILHALRELQASDWVSADRGSRAERFSHRARSRLSITKPQQSILCMTLLRGPQTLAELKSRTERMLNNENELLQALDALTNNEPLLMEKMARQPGQREERYRQWAFPQDISLSMEATSKTAVSEADVSRIDALEEAVKQLTERIEKLEAGR